MLSVFFTKEGHRKNMLGKTHFTVGLAASFALVHPKTFPEFVVGLGAASLGAIISDIDVDTTESHRDADIISAAAVASVVLVVILDKIFNVGVSRILEQRSNLARILLGLFSFIGICGFGKEQPHRSFMHSFIALISLGTCVGVVLPMAVPYFAVAFLSHLAIDLLNTRRVRLLFPLPGGICLKLCKSDGAVNRLLFIAGSVVALVEIAGVAMGFLGNIHIF